MAEPTYPQGMRLINAAAAAFAPLSEFGFRIVDPHPGSGRGADVTLRSDRAAIHVSCDWYEREIGVAIQVRGGEWLPVEQIVPELRAAVRRVPRNAKRSLLQDRLATIAEALVSRAPEVLRGNAPPPSQESSTATSK